MKDVIAPLVFSAFVIGGALRLWIGISFPVRSRFTRNEPGTLENQDAN